MRTGRPIAELIVSAEERATLEGWVRRRSSAQALALRAGIVLDCASGMSNTGVARRRRVSKQRVGKWRSRFVRHRVAGLLDEPRYGASPARSRMRTSKRSLCAPWSGVDIDIIRGACSAGADIGAVTYRCAMLGILEMLSAERLVPWRANEFLAAVLKVAATIPMKWMETGVPQSELPFDVDAFFQEVRKEPT
jgi:hypothetical protein